MKKVILILLSSVVLLLPFSHSFALDNQASVAMQFDKVDINQADVKQLMKLPGIGKKKAQAIVDYRQQNGLFQSVEELSKVKGIGKKLSQKLQAKIEAK